MKKLKHLFLFLLVALFLVSCNNLEKEYKVTFDLNGGTIANDKITVKDGKFSVTVKENGLVKDVVGELNPTKDGYTFEEWKNNDQSFNPNTTKITSNLEVKASWNENTVIPETFELTLPEGVTATVDGNAVVSGTSVEKGKTVVLTVVVPDGKVLSELKVNNVAVVVENNTYSFIMNDATTVTVIFDNETFELTLPEGVTAKVNGEPVSDLTKIVKGTTVTLTVTVPEGKVLKELKVNNVIVEVENNTYSFIMNEATTVTVTFNETFVLTLPESDVTAKVDGNAVVTGANIEKGKTVVLTVIAPDGKELKSVKVNGVEVEAVDGVYSVIMDSNKEVVVGYYTKLEATFAKTGRYGIVPAGNGEHSGNLTIELQMTANGNPVDMRTTYMEKGTLTIGDTTRDLLLNDVDSNHWANVLEVGQGTFKIYSKDGNVYIADLDIETFYTKGSFERTQTPVGQLVEDDDNYYAEYKLLDSSNNQISIIYDGAKAFYQMNSTNTEKWKQSNVFGTDPYYLQKVDGETGSRYMFVVTNDDQFVLAKLDYVKHHIVTFDLEGGTGDFVPLFIEDNKTIDLEFFDNKPTKEGYYFNLWYLNDEGFDYNTLITENITLKASYEKIYSIKDALELEKDDDKYYIFEGTVTAVLETKYVVVSDDDGTSIIVFNYDFDNNFKVIGNKVLFQTLRNDLYGMPQLGGPSGLELNVLKLISQNNIIDTKINKAYNELKETDFGHKVSYYNQKITTLSKNNITFESGIVLRIEDNSSWDYYTKTFKKDDIVNINDAIVSWYKSFQLLGVKNTLTKIEEIESTFVKTGSYGIVPANNGEHTGNLTLEFKLMFNNEKVDLSSNYIIEGTVKNGENTRNLVINSDTTLWANVLITEESSYKFYTKDGKCYVATLDLSDYLINGNFTRTETPVGQLLNDSYKDENYYLEYVIKYGDDNETLGLSESGVKASYQMNSTNDEKWKQSNLFGTDPYYLQLATGETGARYIFAVTNDDQFVLAKLDHVKHFIVTFDNSTTQIIKTGDKVNKPENPTKEGYKFVKWLLNGEEYNFDTPVTANLELVAEFIEVYKLTLPEVGNVTVLNEELDLNAIAKNTDVTIKIVPDAGYKVSSFKVNNEEKLAELVDNQYTFTMTSDVEIVVQYELTEVTLEQIVESAKLYKYDDYTYTKDITNIGNGEVISYNAIETFNNKAALSDMARYLGALYRVQNSSVTSVTFNDVIYTWDDEKELLGSNWANEGITLVSVITNKFLEGTRLFEIILQDDNLNTLTLNFGISVVYDAEFEFTNKIGIVPSDNGEHTGNLTLEFKALYTSNVEGIKGKIIDLNSENIKSGTVTIGEITSDLTINSDTTLWANIFRTGVATYKFVAYNGDVITATLNLSDYYEDGTVGNVLVNGDMISYELKNGETSLDLTAASKVFESDTNKKWTEVTNKTTNFEKAFYDGTENTYAFIVTNDDKLLLFEIEKYFVVTFNLNGENVVGSINPVLVKPSEKVGKPNTDEITNGELILSGWYKEATCENVWDFETDTVTSNLTLYAKWEEAAELFYEIKFGENKYTNSSTKYGTYDFCTITGEKAYWDGDLNNSLRLGSSKYAGTLTISLNETKNIKKIEITAKQYDGPVKLNVNESSNPQSLTENFDIYSFEINTNTKTITIISVEDSKTRILISNIKIYY